MDKQYKTMLDKATEITSWAPSSTQRKEGFSNYRIYYEPPDMPKNYHRFFFTKTPEQLFLMFAMYVIHGKEWNGEKKEWEVRDGTISKE